MKLVRKAKDITLRWCWHGGNGFVKNGKLNSWDGFRVRPKIRLNSAE